MQKQNRRPSLSDPAEWEIVRSMYFAKDNFNNKDSDPIENLERQESKHRNLNKSSR